MVKMLRVIETLEDNQLQSLLDQTIDMPAMIYASKQIDIQHRALAIGRYTEVLVKSGRELFSRWYINKDLVKISENSSDYSGCIATVAGRSVVVSMPNLTETRKRRLVFKA